MEALCFSNLPSLSKTWFFISKYDVPLLLNMFLAHKVAHLFTQHMFVEDLLCTMYAPCTVLVANRKDKEQIFQEKESDKKQIGKQDDVRW